MHRAIESVHSDAQAVLRDRTDVLSPLRNAHLFVTGGTGFLGKWLLEVLSVLNTHYGFGVRATVLTRDPLAFQTQWPHLHGHAWLRLTEGDVRHLAAMPGDVNFVVHGAALTDRRVFASQPYAVAATGVEGTAKVLQASLRLNQLEKFLLISSGLVYGVQPPETPRIDETFAGPLRADDVTAAYAESKRMSEVLTHAFISEYRLPAVILRPFAFVGPYQSLLLPWAVTDFIRDSFNGGPINIMGDGLTVRSIMYASDYAYGVLLALAAGQARQTYNLGSPEPVELLPLARMITELFSPAPEIVTRVGQVGHDRTRLVPDIGKISRDLGFLPTVSLDSALEKTIEWNRNISYTP